MGFLSTLGNYMNENPFPSSIWYSCIKLCFENIGYFSIQSNNFSRFSMIFSNYSFYFCFPFRHLAYHFNLIAFSRWPLCFFNTYSYIAIKELDEDQINHKLKGNWFSVKLPKFWICCSFRCSDLHGHEAPRFSLILPLPLHFRDIYTYTPPYSSQTSTLFINFRHDFFVLRQYLPHSSTLFISFRRDFFVLRLLYLIITLSMTL